MQRIHRDGRHGRQDHDGQHQRGGAETRTASEVPNKGSRRGAHAASSLPGAAADQDVEAQSP